MGIFKLLMGVPDLMRLSVCKAARGRKATCAFMALPNCSKCTAWGGLMGFMARGEVDGGLNP